MKNKKFKLIMTFFEKRLCGKYVEILEKSIKYFTGV